jgi:anti-sigma regulatory factor (Ser/Thr protein kinase)
MTNSDAENFRRRVLRSCGISDNILEETLCYTQNPYAEKDHVTVTGFPLEDESHIRAWEGYVDEASHLGVVPVLREKLVQLRFPIEEGISQTDAYRAATRRGNFEAAHSYASGVSLRKPETVSLALHESIGGRIPVIIADQREDFESLVRALSARNEPEDVPDSMGACIVTGFNNWDRVHAYRRNWEQRQSETATEQAWQQTFREEVVPHKHLYQDRFIILSSGPYSGCSGDSVGVNESDWRQLSVAIRREHEFTHYFTYRLFGLMRNNLLDELIADFVGLVRATGRYDPTQAARFLGVESYPQYREGGRLQNYKGEPPVSHESFQCLQWLASRTIKNLAHFAESRADRLANLSSLGEVVLALSRASLEELASEQMDRILPRRLASTSGTGSTFMVEEHKVELPDSPSALNKLIYEFTTFAERHSIPKKVQREIHLALDEVISNIMNHGYEEGARYNISVTLRLTGDFLEVVVLDDAQPFNLLELEPPEESPYDRGIGGLGVYLVRRLMDDVSYSRDGDQNKVTLRRAVKFSPDEA